MVNDFNTVTCPKCGHDRNPADAKKCEICGQSLRKGGLPIAPLLIGAFALFVLAGGGYFLFRALQPQPGSNVTTTPGQTPGTDPADPAVPSPPAPVNSPPPLAKDQLITAANPELYTALAQIPNVPAGTFNYGGSTTFAPLRSDRVLQAIGQAHPDFRLRYTEPVGDKPGSGTGINMVITGELSFSQSSRPLKDEELGRAAQRGFKLEQVPVAIDGLAFYVNPQLQIPGLTVAQLREIYTGKVTNWNQVGGPDLAVVPLSRDPNAGGTVDFFIESVLEKQPLGSTVQVMRDTTTSLRQVAKTPGGIGYATASEVIGQQTIRPLSIARSVGQPFVSPFAPGDTQTVNEAAIADGSYPLTRRLFIIIKRDGRLDEQAGVAYTNLLLSKEGQSFVKAAGFTPVR